MKRKKEKHSLFSGGDFSWNSQLFFYIISSISLLLCSRSPSFFHFADIEMFRKNKAVRLDENNFAEFLASFDTVLLDCDGEYSTVVDFH
jgi:hypothetical protein